MFKIYDFRCTNGHVFEDFVKSGTTTSRCGCGANATKMVSAPSTLKVLPEIFRVGTWSGLGNTKKQVKNPLHNDYNHGV
jgi:hypothetical protein